MPSANHKKNTKNDNQDEITMTCECGIKVNVGTGGEGNLRQHRKSYKHRYAMQKIDPDEEAKRFKSFFLSAKPAAQPVPVPPRLPLSVMVSPPNVNHTRSSQSDLSVSSPILQQLRQAIKALPPTVAEGTPEDLISVFSSTPALDPTLEDQWEVFDPILNRFLGFGKSVEEIKSTIRTGQYGIDGFYNWISFCMTKGGIAEGLLEGKILRMIEAINTLIHDNAMFASSPAMPEVHLSEPEIIDVDAIIDDTSTVVRETHKMQAVTHSGVKPARRQSQIHCHGLKVEVQPGRSLYSDYPFNIHSQLSLPWLLQIVGEELFLHAEDCLKLCYADPCLNCSALKGNTILCGILQRMSAGAKEHTPYKWLSHAQLEERTYRLCRQVNSLKLHSLNTGRKLARRTTVLDDHKRFVLSIATGKVQNLHRLVAVQLKNKVGIRGIIDRIERAAKDLYSVKSYEERDYHIALLLWRYGGARMAEIGHRALGLPCLETIRKARNVAPLQVSPRYPTFQDITKNLSSYDLSLFNSMGYILMIDELATESRLRYDAVNNVILGICREHSRGYTLSFNGLEEAEVLLKGLQDQKIHFASEATVLAIGSLDKAHQVRQAWPIAISGTCKRESADEHVRLLEVAIQSCENKLGRPIYCVASDGESKRGLALNHITAVSDLAFTSALFPILGELALFDIKVGPNELTVDKDYKHIFKRFRNTFIRLKGILIDGTHITPQVLRQHLCDGGVANNQATLMLNPNDRQDVPLAISLLASIWNLTKPDTTHKATYHATRIKLNLFGELVAAFVQPYLMPSLSLTEQLCYLSKAAHLALALYILGGTKFIPTQLYSDLQLAIKNVYFCVAKTQRDFPDSSFYITLLGTDRLEMQFGNLRTIVGNDTNADLLQIGSRLAAAAECSSILSKHPEWDRGPHRLQIPSLDERGMLSNAIDHLSPDHWKGNTKVSNVSLTTTWSKGRLLAEESLGLAKVDFSFTDLDSKPTITMLAPCGVPLFKRKLEPEEIDDEDISNNVPSHLQPETPVDDEVDPDLEDVVNEESCIKGHSHTIEMNGKQIHKASILRVYSHPSTHAGPKSTDRLRRVRGYTRFENMATETSDISGTALSTTVFINDPVLTLVKVEDEIFLAVGQINGIKVEGCNVHSLPESDLRSNTKVFFQILKLVTCEPTSDEPPCDWVCDGSIVNYGSTYGILEARGDLVQVFNPVISCNREGKPLLNFSSIELTAITAILHQQLADLRDCHVPTANLHDFFPYRHNGKACFNCEQENNERLGLDTTFCVRCYPQVDPGTGAHLIAHNSAHILFDGGLQKTVVMPCAFCLRASPACLLFLTGVTDVQIDYKKSICPVISRFSYKPASQYTPKNPCTNVPLSCPLCPPRSPAIWRYNLKQHLELSHPESAPDDYRDLWQISEDEKYGMENKWRTIRNSRVTKNKKKKAGFGRQKLTISDGHSSRLTLRDTDLILPDSETIQSGVPNGNLHHPSKRKAVEVDGGEALESSAEEDTCGNSGDEDEYRPTGGDQAKDDAPALFTEVAYSRRGRRSTQRITFFEEICDCGMGDTSVDIRQDDWKDTPELIECQAVGCETKAFHLNCQGLQSIPLNWICRSCKSMGRRATKRRRKDK